MGKSRKSASQRRTSAHIRSGAAYIRKLAPADRSVCSRLTNGSNMLG
ncbi:hypothetical protein [Curtobacterium sp. NPDC086286]